MRVTFGATAGEELALEVATIEVDAAPASGTALVGLIGPDGSTLTLELDRPEAADLINRLMQAVHSLKLAAKATRAAERAIPQETPR